MQRGGAREDGEAGAEDDEGAGEVRRRGGCVRRFVRAGAGTRSTGGGWGNRKPK